jgi:hypothetical protein
MRQQTPHAWEPGEWCGDRVIPTVVKAEEPHTDE